jgi:predicted permease
MNQKRFLGLVLMLAGILFYFSSAVLTGAAIGISSSSVAQLSGALITFAGIVIFLLGQKEVLLRSLKKYEN